MVNKWWQEKTGTLAFRPQPLVPEMKVNWFPSATRLLLELFESMCVLSFVCQRWDDYQKWRREHYVDNSITLAAEASVMEWASVLSVATRLPQHRPHFYYQHSSNFFFFIFKSLFFPPPLVHASCALSFTFMGRKQKIVSYSLLTHLLFFSIQYLWLQLYLL